MIKKKDPSSTQLIKENPILDSKTLSKFSFHLFLAVQNIEDIHPLTFKQIS